MSLGEVSASRSLLTIAFLETGGRDIRDMVLGARPGWAVGVRCCLGAKACLQGRVSDNKTSNNLSFMAAERALHLWGHKFESSRQQST